MNCNEMRILHGYPYYPANNTYGNVEKINLGYLQRLREGGIDIEGFCLTIDPPNECLSFKDLDSVDFKVKMDLNPGLYYWKLMSADEIHQAGRIRLEKKPGPGNQ